MRMIPHTFWALSSCNSFVVLSNDTDILLLLLRYTHVYMSLGLKSLYMRIGIGRNTRFLSIHKLAISFGEQMCRNLLKAHIATGCDWISKLGVKNKVLEKINLLNEFAEDDLNMEMMDKAEEYLCSVLMGNFVKFQTFNDVRYFPHVKNKVLIQSIVPSSTCTLGSGIEGGWNSTGGF